MIDNQHNDNDPIDGSRWKYNNPKYTLTPSSKWGFAIFAIVATVLFFLDIYYGIPPASPRAILADFVLAGGLSALGVFGVGGMIEIGGKLKDMSIKAGGGIAIIVLIMFVFQPFHSSKVDTSYDEVFEVDPYGSIGTLLKNYNNQFFNDEKDAIQVVIAEEIRDRVINFKAEPVGQKAKYRASWDILRQRNPRLEILSSIARRQSCLSFIEESDTRAIANLDGILAEHDVPGEERKIFTCSN